ncbi:Pentatricopeptide repeat-containing protein [Nymphaea thermarum]|nr:Pentatricopeptide repeat-containing protein [Nymphaea thermarum]
MAKPPLRQPPDLAKTLISNAHSPEFAWRFFKFLFDKQDPTPPPLLSVSVITRILSLSRMLPQLHHLRKLLSRLPPDFAVPALSTVITQMAAITTDPTSDPSILDAALSAFQSLRSDFPGSQPPHRAYTCLLRALLRHGRPEPIPAIYSDMLRSGFFPDTTTLNLLMSALADSGRVDDARQLLEKMPVKGLAPNSFTYGLLARAYCRSGCTAHAFELLDDMERHGCRPNRVIYNTLISGFCRENKVNEAEKVWEIMCSDGFSPDIVTFNSRITMLCRGGKLLEASKIFVDMQLEEGLPLPNHVTFNIMLDGFCKAGDLAKAEKIVGLMKKLGLLRTLESYSIWVYGLVRKGRLCESQIVLKEMTDDGIAPNLHMYNILIDGLCKAGMFMDARVLMDTMRNNGIIPDKVSYNTLLNGYCSKGRVSLTYEVLNEMQRNGCFPTAYTCNILLKSLWKEGRASEAELLLKKMNEKGHRPDTITCNIMIDGLCKTGKLDKAMKIAGGMWDHGAAALGDLENVVLGLVDGSYGDKCHPDVVTYSTLIDGLLKAGKFDEAKQKFVEMMDNGIVPDRVIYDTFIDGFAKHGKVSAAHQVLIEMEINGCDPSVRSYNSLMWGLASKGKVMEIRSLINNMKNGKLLPDAFSYNCLIKSLCEGGKVMEAASVLDEMLGRGIIPNIMSFKILLKAFCDIQDFEAAEKVSELAHNFCYQKKVLHQLMFEKFCAAGRFVNAQNLLEMLMRSGCTLEGFSYTSLIKGLCEAKKLNDTQLTLKKLVDRGYVFDPAAFMPLIDALGKEGNKQEADKLGETMMDMAARYEDLSENIGTAVRPVRSNILQNTRGKENKLSTSDWQSLLHRDDGGLIVLKLLKRVRKGWGQGTITSFLAEKNDNLDNWLDVG